MFPLTVENDIPFCLSPGYSLAGLALRPSVHLDYCEKNCELRTSPLTPSASPLLTVESITASERWHRLFTNTEDGAYTQYLLRLQSLRAASTVRRAHVEQRGLCPACVSKEEADKAWQRYSGDRRLMGASWNADAQHFEVGQSGPARP